VNKTLVSVALVAACSQSNLVSAETNVSTKGGLKVTSGEHSVQFGGRIQYDYFNTELNGETIDDQFDLRRGRVFVKGNVSSDWHFKVNYNVNGGGTEDMYVRYTGWGGKAVVTVGKQHQAFTLEQLMSSKDIAIIERSAITERYLIGRKDGIQLHGNTERLHYAIGAFSEEEADDTKEEEFGIAGRVAYLPYKSDNGLVHLGASYKDIDDISGSGVELAATSGAFYFQTEFFQQEQDSQQDIDGFYVQLAYTLTGEKRPYKEGVFKRIKPSSKSGAWEVAARFESGDGKFSDIELGSVDAEAYVIGVNYYANDNLKISMSYSQGETAEFNEDGIKDEGKELRASMLLAF